ncbi:MAG: nucleotidyltransferase family protein [Nitrososphaerota archaeon]|nr:nucleotidyltransferase family protein [Nitrososphaerales archaeon]MCX8191431.1 nucleotidyltransferase family protein [Nitrososphaerales archaeon]MDW8045374.1 nucleotidyltransferase family protein [Nitrososphaerota archaeon]
MVALKAVILAGGLGTRLRPYTFFLPKPMLPLGHKPVLEHIIDWLRDNGIYDIIISVEYLKMFIEGYFEDGHEWGVRISYAHAKRPLGTAGQLKVAEKYIDGTFICIYGDTILNFDLKDALNFHKDKGALATMILKPYKISLKYGFIEIDDDGAIKRWREKPKVSGLINTGCYIMEPRFLQYIPTDVMYGMDRAFKNALRAKERIFGYITKGEFIDIGDKKTYLEAYEKYLRRLGKIL